MLIGISEGILDSLSFRVLQSLEESGEENEVALYKGGLYMYTNGAWKNVSTGNYKGALAEPPAAEEESFFLASDNFEVTDVFIVNGEELYVNGDAFYIKRVFTKGLIYYVQDGIWYCENDKTNWRYAAAFADVINVTGKLPQIFQDAIDDLQDQIDDISDSLDSTQASLEDEIAAREGGYTIINGDMVQIGPYLGELVE